MSSLPDNQHMARVTIESDRWVEFRALSVRKKRSVAAYLGHLVGKELGREERVERRREERQARSGESHEDEVDETWIPPWEL